MPELTPERLERNLARIRERLAEAAAKSSRDPAAVTLVAVTKSVGVAETRELLKLGVQEFGENRVQHAQPKIEALAGEFAAAGARWRMLGHLQTNKARQALALFQALDAVDSVRLLEELAKEACRRGLARVPCLAEVNVSGEAQKFGLRPPELPEFLARASEVAELEIRGLMAMAPYADAPEQVEGLARPVFRGLRELGAQANEKAWYRQRLPELSMGMSHDFTIAVEEGATMVRIGTALWE